MRMESKFGARALENKPFLANNEWKVVVKGSTLLLNEEDFICISTCFASLLVVESSDLTHKASMIIKCSIPTAPWQRTATASAGTTLAGAARSGDA